MTGDPTVSAPSLLLPHNASTPIQDMPAVHTPDPLQRPTIILPALKDRPSTAISLFPHLKTMAARARAGITPVPTTPSDDSQSAVGARAPAGITPVPTTPSNDSQSAVGALAAHPSQSDSEMTDPGDTTTPTGASGPFDADAFFSNAAEGTTTPTPPVYPTAAPSAKRTVRRQSSKTFDNATAPADKSLPKQKADPPKFFHDSDMMLYNHIGLAPPVAGETAIPQRERMIQNEVKIVAYITSLERAATAARSEAAARNTEFARILADTQSSLRNSDVGSADATDVAPLKLGLEAVRADLNHAVSEFSLRLSELGSGGEASPDLLALKFEVAELRADLLAAENHRMITATAASVENDPAFQALVRDVGSLRAYISSNPSAPAFVLEDDTSFRTLRSTVEADTLRMDNIINALPPPEFYDAIASMRGDITFLAAKAEKADRTRDALAISSVSPSIGSAVTHTSSIPSMFMPATAGTPATTARTMTIAHTPSSVFLPGLTSVTAQDGNARPTLFHSPQTMDHASIGLSNAPQPFTMPAALTAANLPALKRPALPFAGPAGKRARLDVAQHSWPDVLFGPVTISPSMRTDLKSLAVAAIKYLVRIAAESGQHCVIGEEDVASTQIDRSSTNTLSIRFKSREKATLFCALVEHYSPLPGQVAVFRGQSGGQHSRTSRAATDSGIASNQTLMDLFGGAGTVSSNR
ncbi:hypothetical protein B0H14DRAFT_2708952 [Mycena olivaceomarginata]|nr:hypothetical protein B0H14DRAFT_2708952 [Mycena olivaceomarginata]